MVTNEKAKFTRALEFAPIWAVLAIGRLLPFGLRGKFFQGLGGFVVSNLPSARKRVQKGLNLVFPELSTQEIDRITKEVGRNTALTLSELLMNDDYRKRLDLFSAKGHGLEVLKKARRDGKGAIIVSAHFGQWEAIRHHMAAEGLETGAVYRENNNPWYERRFLWAISQGGSPIVARGNKGNVRMVRHLRKGGFFALLVDQKSYSGLDVPFLGHDARTSTSPAELALRYDLPLVPVFATRQNDGRSIVIDYEDPIAPSDVRTMTTQINDRISARIREKPEQWYWLHNRWG